MMSLSNFAIYVLSEKILSTLDPMGFVFFSWDINKDFLGKSFSSNNLGEILEGNFLNDLHGDFFATTVVVVLV